MANLIKAFDFYEMRLIVSSTTSPLCCVCRPFQVQEGDNPMKVIYSLKKTKIALNFSTVI